MPTGVYVRKPKPLADPMPRFWKYVQKTEGCWLWIGACTPQGYGVFWFNGDSIPAHRFAYEHLVKALGRLWACHHCDNPKCVRPDHLFAGTVKDNVQDAIRKNRWNYEKRVSELYVRGVENHNAKLNPTKVREIRRLSGKLSMKALARIFGVTKFAIYSVIHRLTWKQVL
jgi:hypothetical protein